MTCRSTTNVGLRGCIVQCAAGDHVFAIVSTDPTIKYHDSIALLYYSMCFPVMRFVGYKINIVALDKRCVIEQPLS